MLGHLTKQLTEVLVWVLLIRVHSCILLLRDGFNVRVSFLHPAIKNNAPLLLPL